MIESKSPKGKRMSNEEIAKLGILTNSVSIKVNEKKFFQKYRIISYYTNNADKNLSYEKLGKQRYISVAGIWNFWDSNQFGYVKFFILVNKEDTLPIIEELNEEFYAEVDDLQYYPDNIRECVLGNLMINALNQRKENGCTMMYNSGNLYVHDEENFGNFPGGIEKVCLRIELNRYLQLVASVTTFAPCRNKEDFTNYKKNKAIFKRHRYVDGDNWSGETFEAVSRFDQLKDGDFEWNELLIKRSISSDSHNTAPFISFRQEHEEHSRVMVLAQIVDSTNEKFKGIGKITFKSYKISKFDQYTRRNYKKDAESLIRDYFSDKPILLENTIKPTENSILFVESIKDVVCKITQKDSSILEEGIKPSENMVLRIIEVNDEQRKRHAKQNRRKKRKGDDEFEQAITQTACEEKAASNIDNYIKGLERSKYQSLQHITYDNQVGITNNEVHRILLELLVKDSIATRTMPSIYRKMLQGWEVIGYRVNKKDRVVYGTSMTTTLDGQITFTDYGCSNNRWTGLGFNTFVNNKLHFPQPNLIFGSQWYKVMIKENNVYLIVSTDEFPMLNTDELSRYYSRFHTDPETGKLRKSEDFRYTLVKNLFRVENVDRLLCGLIGFRYWNAEPLTPCGQKGISYLVGLNHDLNKKNIKEFSKTAKVKKIFVLSSQNPQKVPTHLKQIFSMLKHPFGRSGEMATYPLPFKFVDEYLDNVTLERHGIHWKEFNSKRFDEV